MRRSSSGVMVAPRPMQILSFPSPLDLDALVFDLWEFATLGVVEADSYVHAYFPESANLSPLKDKYPALLKSHSDADIVPDQALPDPADPIEIGRHFVVTDLSHAGATGESDRHVLRVNSTAAFGSGRHESTQLIIEALELVSPAGAVVLDTGCGTAIASEAARKLGALQVFACDIDCGALLTARHNFPGTELFLGSVDAIASQSVDIVIANISARVIDSLAAELRRVCKPDGALILGGFVADKPPENFASAKQLAKGDWICWICRPGDARLTLASPCSVQPFEASWW